MKNFYNIGGFLYAFDKQHKLDIIPEYFNHPTDVDASNIDGFIADYFSENYRQDLSNEELVICFGIADNFLKKCVDSPSASLKEFSHYLWILFSQDFRTKEIGFDIQEYTDYFLTIDTPERIKLAEKLRSDWNL